MSIISDLILVGDVDLEFLALKALLEIKMKKKLQQKTVFKKYFTIIKKLNLKHFTLIAISCIVGIALVLASQRINAKEILDFNRNPKNYNAKLQIIDKEKQIAEFSIAIADDDNKKMYGLMNLEKLPQEQGMLFTFSKKQVINMWMKNTKIPLDMIFIDENDIITNTVENAIPNSLDLISSINEVKKVLEINAGLVRKFKIENGQKIKIIKENASFFSRK